MWGGVSDPAQPSETERTGPASGILARGSLSLPPGLPMLVHSGRGSTPRLHWRHRVGFAPTSRDRRAGPVIATSPARRQLSGQYIAYLLRRSHQPRRLGRSGTVRRRRHVRSRRLGLTPGKMHLRQWTCGHRAGLGLPHDSHQSVGRIAVSRVSGETTPPRIAVPAAQFSATTPPGWPHRAET